MVQDELDGEFPGGQNIIFSIANDDIGISADNDGSLIG